MRELDKLKIKEFNNLDTKEDIINVLSSDEFEKFAKDMVNSDEYKLQEEEERKYLEHVRNELGFDTHKNTILKLSSIIIDDIENKNYLYISALISNILKDELSSLGDIENNPAHLDELNDWTSHIKEDFGMFNYHLDYTSENMHLIAAKMTINWLDELIEYIKNNDFVSASSLYECIFGISVFLTL